MSKYNSLQRMVTFVCEGMGRVRPRIQEGDGQRVRGVWELDLLELMGYCHWGILSLRKSRIRWILGLPSSRVWPFRASRS